MTDKKEAIAILTRLGTVDFKDRDFQMVRLSLQMAIDALRAMEKSANEFNIDMCGELKIKTPIGNFDCNPVSFDLDNTYGCVPRLTVVYNVHDKKFYR